MPRGAQLEAEPLVMGPLMLLALPFTYWGAGALLLAWPLEWLLQRQGLGGWLPSWHLALGIYALFLSAEAAVSEELAWRPALLLAFGAGALASLAPWLPWRPGAGLGLAGLTLAMGLGAFGLGPSPEAGASSTVAAGPAWRRWAWWGPPLAGLTSGLWGLAAAWWLPLLLWRGAGLPPRSALVSTSPALAALAFAQALWPTWQGGVSWLGLLIASSALFTGHVLGLPLWWIPGPPRLRQLRGLAWALALGMPLLTWAGRP